MLCTYQTTAGFPTSGKQAGRIVPFLNRLAVFISCELLPNIGTHMATVFDFCHIIYNLS